MLVVLLAIAWPAPARASCAYTGPLCQVWKGYDAIFDGTVRSIERVDRDEELGERTERVGHRLVTFEVHEWWRGGPSRQVELFLWGGTWPDGGVIVSGGFDVRVGERYVIFAHRNPRGELTTSDCFGSSRYASASHQLAFLRSLKDGTARPRIQGHVGGPYPPSFGESARTETTATVRLSGDAVSREIRVVSGSRFEFADLPTGVYTLIVTGPPDLLTFPSTVSVTLDDPQSCREVMVSFQHNTSISGLALDRAGKPLAAVRVEAAPAATWMVSGSAWSDHTNEDGRFDLSGLPPGEYVVGLNLRDDVRYSAYRRTIYGSAVTGAETITLVAGQHVWLGQWTLPTPLREVRMRLRVVSPDGQPLPRAVVGLIDVTDKDNQHHVYGNETDDQGIVVFEGRGSRVYALEWWSDRSDVQLPRSRPFPATEVPGVLTTGDGTAWDTGRNSSVTEGTRGENDLREADAEAPGVAGEKPNRD